MAISTVGLTNAVNGILPVANGGTGQSTSLIPSGTVMMFGQTAAPTGWTKVTTNDNAALRVVSGTVGTGGSVNFTTAFASQTPAGSIAVSGGSVSATTLTSSQIPSHTHSYSGSTGTVSADHYHTFTKSTGGYDSGMWHYSNASSASGDGGNNSSQTTSGISANHTHAYSGTTDGGTGGAGSHTHGFTNPTATFTGTAINLAVKYVDVIIATKD